MNSSGKSLTQALLKRIMAWPIKLQLAMLVLCALLPALAVLLQAGLDQRRMAMLAAHEQALDMVKELSQSQERIVSSSRTLLLTLSRIPEIKDLDVQASTTLLGELLSQNPDYSTLALFDATGKLVASALPVKPFSVADRDYFVRVLRGRSFVLGGYALSRTTGGPVLHFACPVLRADGEVSGVLVASFDLWQYVRIFSASQISIGSSLSITGSDGRRLCSFPEDSPSVGEADNPEILELMRAGGASGTFWATEDDKVPRLYGYRRLVLESNDSGWVFIRVGIPEAKALAGFHSLLRRNLILLGAAALLPLFLAWQLGKLFFVGRLERLIKTARRLERGDFGTRTALDYEGEIGELALAFDELSRALREREAARRKAQRKLELLITHLKTAVQDRTRKLSAKAKELEQANACLLEVDKVKSAVLTTVSHDLRTPLTSLRGFAKLVRRDFQRFFLPLAAGEAKLAEKGGRIERNLAIMESEGERLTRLINDFLDLSRIESGRVVWRETPCDLREQASLALDAVSGEFAHNPAVELKSWLCPGAVPVLADPDRLQQVFINLLSNAAKFTSQGSVQLEVEAGASEAAVYVSDTGLGIEVSQLDRIFDMFHTASNENTVEGKPKSIGLGLAICRGIVEHYGGRIWAESTPGQGSRFCFTLPLHKPGQASAQA